MEFHDKKYLTLDKDWINKKFDRWLVLKKIVYSKR